jgi:hypothetical protein
MKHILASMLRLSLLLTALVLTPPGYAIKLNPSLTRGALASGWNCTLELAFKPPCGKFSSDSYVNANAGIDLSKIKTAVVPFGDSWTYVFLPFFYPILD